MKNLENRVLEGRSTHRFWVYEYCLCVKIVVVLHQAKNRLLANMFVTQYVVSTF
jgi:hypothetical protein